MARAVASTAASAYNTFVETKATVQSNNAQSAAAMIDLKKDTAAGLTDFVTETYGQLSPRNQEIISNAAAKMKELQANGASQAEIAKVFLTACREVGKNVGETVSTDVFETMTGKDAYISPNDAAKAFGKDANTLTKNTGNEHMAAMYSVDVFGNRVYFNGNIYAGENYNVVAPFLLTSTAGALLEKATLGGIQL